MSLPRSLVIDVGRLAARRAGRCAGRPTIRTAPVNFIVPFAAGGVTSLFARVLGSKLEQRLGKPFVVENRPGGGGVTGGVRGRATRRPTATPS